MLAVLNRHCASLTLPWASLTLYFSIHMCTIHLNAVQIVVIEALHT